LAWKHLVGAATFPTPLPPLCAPPPLVSQFSDGVGNMRPAEETHTQRK